MKKKNEPAAVQTPEVSDPERVAQFCATDLAQLAFARTMFEAMGRFQGSNLGALSVAYVDESASEFIILDRDVGSPGWVYQTRIPCSAPAGKWSCSAVSLFQEIMRAPPPASVVNVVLAVRDGKPVLEDAAGGEKPWSIAATPEPAPKQPGLGVREFPVPAALLIRLIESVAPSVCQDTIKTHMSQVIFEFGADNCAHSVSTDGHRLTKTNIDAVLPPELRGSYGVPLRLIRPLVQFLRSASVVQMSIVKGGAWSARIGVHQFVILPTDAAFPPYQQIIPSNMDRGPRVRVETHQLVKALKHFDKIRRALREPDKRGVAIDVTPAGLRLWSDTLSNQDWSIPATDCVWVDSEAGPKKKGAAKAAPDKLSLGLSLHYFLSAVRQIGGDQMWLEFGGELDPVVLRPADGGGGGLVTGSTTFVVVMPMRL